MMCKCAVMTFENIVGGGHYQGILYKNRCLHCSFYQIVSKYFLLVFILLLGRAIIVGIRNVTTRYLSRVLLELHPFRAMMCDGYIYHWQMQNNYNCTKRQKNKLSMLHRSPHAFYNWRYGWVFTILNIFLQCDISHLLETIFPAGDNCFTVQ